MTAPVTVRERDLRALASIVSEDRPDLPDGEGLPPSLVAGLMGQIRCDWVWCAGFYSGRLTYWFGQEIIPPIDMLGRQEELDLAHWEHYWDGQPCSYPDRSGDQRTVIKIADSYSARQFHSTGMYSALYRPIGAEHELQLCLPDPAGPTAGPGRTVRLYFVRGPGGFLRARPGSAHAAAPAPAPGLPGHQAPPPSRLPAHPPAMGAAAPTGGRAHQHADCPPPQHFRGNRPRPPGNIYERLGVSSRTAAVIRAFPNRVA